MQHRLESKRVPLALALMTAGAMLAVVSCGSRTGLFAPDESALRADGSADGGLEVDGAVPCLPGRFAFDLALTQLMFVIDRSGSMAFDLQGRGGDGSSIREEDKRWRVLQRGLARTITTFDQQISMGAKFFPEVLADRESSNSELACRTDTGVAIAPARGNAANILSVFDTSQPRGGTPTAEAVRIAAQFLTRSRSVARTIVLATDGAPNCNADLDPRTCICTTAASAPACSSLSTNRGRYSCLDDNRAINTVRDVAQVQRIPVYVIGIGSTEQPAFLKVLDDMAVAGGRARPTTPRHYSVQSASDLNNALETIRDSVTKCTYLTPSSPTNPNNIAVEIDGLVIPRDQTKTSGWDWIDQSFGELAFFGEACQLAEKATTKSVVAGVISCEE